MASTKNSASSKTKEGKASTARKKKEALEETLPPPEKKGKADVYTPNLAARLIGAVVCLFLAGLLVLGMTGTQAVVVDFLCRGIKGLFGYGFWVAAAALVAAALLLLLQRQKPVRLRLWCAGLLPLFFGALLHTFLSPYDYVMEVASFSKLWQDGMRPFSGGVLGGFLSVSFSAWFSKIAAILIFLMVLLLLLAVILHLTPARIAAGARKRRERELGYHPRDDRRDYPEELPPEESIWVNEEAPRPVETRQDVRRRETPAVPPPRLRRRTRPSIDVPLDEDEPVKASAEEEKAPAGKGRRGGKASREVPASKEPAVPEAPPIPEEKGITPPVWTDMEPEAPQTRSQRKEQIRQESDQVAQEAEKSLGESERHYVYPPLDLLAPPSGEGIQAAREELEGTMERLSSVLVSFGIDGRVTGAVQGPSVTRYEVFLEQGVRLNKLTNLSDDVALALGVSSVRIAPVPGKISVVGIEVPNSVVIPVPIREVLDSPAFRRHKSSAAFSVGKDIGGNYIVGDCAKLPHMLIAGTTGSGKSVCINSLIISMLYKSTPEELRLIMVDPKMVELGGYNNIPHLLIPVVTDPKKAAGALQWAVTEMMKRYRLFAEAGVRELSSYNQWAKKQGSVETMPKIVIVIDELADLMLVAAKEVEESICRVAQMGRAAGMHLVIATQRPSADVITGLMKANIPSRIAFAVASSLESRIILDNTGAEKLVGKGDMLWFPLGSGKPLRVQGCFISDEEVAAVVDCVKQNSEAEYDDDVMDQIEQHVTESEKKGKSSSAFPAGDGPEEEQDELFPAAVDVILELGQASVSMLQRRLKLGYARAARLVDQMEEQGIVGPFEGSKPRQLLITKEQWAQMQSGGDAAVSEDPGEAVEEEILTFDPVPQSYEEP